MVNSKCLRTLLLVEHAPELHADRRSSLECTACYAISDLIEFEPCRLQERLAFVCSKLPELRIPAHDEPFIGMLRVCKLAKALGLDPVEFLATVLRH